YSWIVDGVPVSGSSSSYEFVASNVGSHVVRVVVSDGYSEVDVGWAIEVRTSPQPPGAHLEPVGAGPLIEVFSGIALASLGVLFLALKASALLVLLCLTVFTSNTSLPTNPAGTVRALAPTNNFDQFVIVLMENHDLSDIYGPATYMTQLADQNAFAQHWASITNPSQPNYIALIGGSTFGVSGDGNHPNLNQKTIVDIVETSGHTWNAIAQGI